jgi:hypothetical protein
VTDIEDYPETTEWSPIKWLHRHNLTKRDTFEPWY